MERKRVRKEFNLKSRTKQAFKDECDINVIMRRFKKVCGTEFLEKFAGYTGGEFGDFSNVVDYRSAIEQVRAAEAVFGALPAILRKRFDNDAAAFLDFCQNPDNLEEMVELGLATKNPPVQDAVSQPVSLEK